MAAPATTSSTAVPGGFDNLFGEEGDDTLTLATSDFGGVASGGDGDDTLFGSDTSFSNFDNSLQGDAGDDDLHAGSVGSFLGGGSGADRLFSSAADDQMDGGRDEIRFALDGAQDLFVYTGTGRWSSEGSFFGDQISGFEDGYGPVRPARQRVRFRRSDDRQRRFPDDDHVEPRDDHDLREFRRAGLHRRERFPFRPGAGHWQPARQPLTRVAHDAAIAGLRRRD